MSWLSLGFEWHYPLIFFWDKKDDQLNFRFPWLFYLDDTSYLWVSIPFSLGFVLVCLGFVLACLGFVFTCLGFAITCLGFVFIVLQHKTLAFIKNDKRLNQLPKENIQFLLYRLPKGESVYSFYPCIFRILNISLFCLSFFFSLCFRTFLDPWLKNQSINFSPELEL